MPLNPYRRIFDNLYDGLYFVDQDGIIRYWNKAAEKITGYAAAEVLGKSCSENLLTHVDANGINLCQGMCPLGMANSCMYEAQVFLHHKEGHRIPVSVRVSPMTDEKGNIIGKVELFRDISSYRIIEERVKELEEIALFDNLTRLGNRNYLEKEFFIRFDEHKRVGSSFGVLLMDIDHFKKFNDTYGHDVGDRVLRFVADTLANNVRPFDVIGRWGGEEFIAILRNVTSEQLEHLGNRLRVLAASSYIPWEEGKLQVTISIGATLVQDGDTVDIIFKRADRLLYESKRAGRNRLTMG